MPQGLIRVGCAGWALRKESAATFPPPGSHLERYARRFNAVEINSSFYRPHRRSTYERWAASVPESFRFSVKAPKAITHEARLAHCDAALERFLNEVSGLGAKLGPLLFQLPPSFAFDHAEARVFFAALRQAFNGAIVCEPRHATWFGDAAAALLREFHVELVEADPPSASTIARNGLGEVSYFRLHGSPRTYYSAYTPENLTEIAIRLQQATRSGREAWCIFDNTAAGAAIENALHLQSVLSAGPGKPVR